ncbi:MAG TPA: hypothetical protein VGC25_01845 [Alphaproteobacteria bacterium]
MSRSSGTDASAGMGYSRRVPPAPVLWPRAIGYANILGFAIFAMVLAAFSLNYLDAVANDRFIDTDAYTRVVKAMELWRSGDWWDGRLLRVNPPDGHFTHWTRPLDALLIAVPALLSPLIPFEQGLRVWAHLVNPLLLLALVGLLPWIFRPLVPRPWAWLLMAIPAVQLDLLFSFSFGRPDHNGLILITAGLLTGLMVRLAAGPGAGRLAWAAGAAAGFGLWVSVEFLIVAVLAELALGLLWLRRGRPVARAGVALSAATAAAVAVFLLAERGPSAFTDVYYDAFSIAHVALFAAAAAFWALALAADAIVPETPARRLLAGAAAAMPLLALLGWAYPGFFASPLAEVDPAYAAQRLQRIHELQPITLFPRGGIWVGQNITRVLYPVLALVGFGLVWRRTPEQFARWLFPALALAAYFPMTLWQVRWSGYAQFFSIAPLCLVYAMAIAFLARRLGARLGQVLRPVILTVLLALPIALTVSIARLGNTERHAAFLACDITPAVRALEARIQENRIANPITLAFPDFAPEILYRTRSGVLAFPNHRFQPKFTLIPEVLTAAEPARAEALLRAARVTHLLICGDWTERSHYVRKGVRTLYDRLAEGERLPFLAPVPVPGEAAGVSLFEVRPRS